jgi:hypothetical protein
MKYVQKIVEGNLLTVPMRETSIYCDDRSIEEKVNEGDADGLAFAAYALTENVELVPFMNQQLRYGSY